MNRRAAEDRGRRAERIAALWLRLKGYRILGTRVRTQYDRPWGTRPRTSHLVVIAEQADIDEAAIRAVLGA